MTTLERPARWQTTRVAIPSTASTFLAGNDEELFYRAWPTTGPAERALVMIHRGHEHSGRFEDVVPALGLDRTAVFAWDARGHGRSPGRRGDAPDVRALVDDLDRFVAHIGGEHGFTPGQIVVMGHSVGAVVVATWLHDHAPAVRAAVLVAPAFDVKLYVPFARPGLRLMQWARGDRPAFVRSYVKPAQLTHDPAQQAAYRADPLITRDIAVPLLLDLYATAERVVADAGAIVTPTLTLTAGADWVVHAEAQRRFHDRLGTSVKRRISFPGMYHDLLHETERQRVFEAIRTFIEERFADGADHRVADVARQIARGEALRRRLATPLPIASPRRWWFAAQRLGLRLGGRLSHAIGVGWRHGFDSGRSLDCVYENRPRGFTAWGRAVDRAYLNAVGWRGIRQRGAHLRQMLQEAIADAAVECPDRPVRVLDIASGPGRYLLETAAACGVPVELTLRDNQQTNLEAAAELSRRLGLADVRFERRDALDAGEVADVPDPVDVAIVSGLYELIDDNASVGRSLAGLGAAVRPGGRLIYTNQPWHPQLEMIARCLPNREGARWVMRCRSQAEMNLLASGAGFLPQAMRTDRRGIFTVTVAAKVGG